jgi:hypothetical protein
MDRLEFSHLLYFFLDFLISIDVPKQMSAAEAAMSGVRKQLIMELTMEDWKVSMVI